MSREEFINLMTQKPDDFGKVYDLMHASMMMAASDIVYAEHARLAATKQPEDSVMSLVRSVELAKMSECSLLLLEAAKYGENQ